MACSGPTRRWTCLHRVVMRFCTLRKFYNTLSHMLKGWVVFTFFSLKTANPFCYRCAEKDVRYRTCLAESHGVIWKRCEGTSLCELASSDEEMNATRCLDDDDGRQYDKYIYMEYRCDDPGMVCNIASRDGHLENRFRRIRISTRAAESQDGPQGRTSLRAPRQNILNYGQWRI